MPFLTEPEPERGAVLPVLPGISRIVADNPGPMTYYGTNTYLIDTPDGIAVLDPGPEDHPEHVEAILRATGAKVALILVSHTHHDHVGAVPALRQATGAPTVGFRDSGDDTFTADERPTGPGGCRRCLRDGARARDGRVHRCWQECDQPQEQAEKQETCAHAGLQFMSSEKTNRRFLPSLFGS